MFVYLTCWSLACSIRGLIRDVSLWYRWESLRVSGQKAESDDLCNLAAKSSNPRESAL